MNIVKFNNKFEEVLDLAGYKLYFGTRQLYNAERRDSYENEVILEPFQIKLQIENKCSIQTNFTLWISKRKQIDDKFGDKEGMNTAYIQEMINDTHNILNEINESGFMMIPKKLDEIVLQFYNADSSMTVYTSSLIKITFPIIIHGEN